MAVVAEAQKNQIMLINWLASPRGDCVELLFVLLRCDLGINFSAHAHDRFFGHAGRHEKIFARHSKVALGILGWNATFVSEREPNLIPWKIARLRRNPGVNRRGRIPA